LDVASDSRFATVARREPPAWQRCGSRGFESALWNERIDPTTGGDEFKENVAACAVLRKARVEMETSSSRSISAQEHIEATLPPTGFVRLASILAPRGPIPVGRSTWWAGIKTGRFPKPVKLGPRTTAWKVEDIRRLIEQAE
jgi:predicted DNA-binding transcriptional regulator AlpA